MPSTDTTHLLNLAFPAELIGKKEMLLDAMKVCMSCLRGYSVYASCNRDFNCWLKDRVMPIIYLLHQSHHQCQKYVTHLYSATLCNLMLS